MSRSYSPVPNSRYGCAPENFADLPVGADLIDRHPVDVLGGHVGSSLGERHAVDEPLLGAGEHRRALDQLVAVEREHPPSTVSPGLGAARPTLEQRRDRLRRPHLHDQIEVRHVDTEFEARRRGHHVQRARLQPLLDPSTLGLAEAPVVTARVRLVVAEPLAKLSKGAFGARPRVREH